MGTANRLIAWGLAALCAAASAAEPAPTPVTPHAAPAAAAHSLERGDVESWLDGFMPYALERGDSAGAVVAVVKNGAVLLVKGYGPRHVAILATELIAKPPAVIVRVPGTCPIMEPGPECMPASVTLAAFARGHYTLDKTIGDYEVWVRNTP